MNLRASADAVRLENQKYFVYIIRLSNGSTYVGCTSDLDDRLERHQRGYVDSTKHFLPVELIFYCIFFDKYKAYTFEKYLKSGSGRAFTIRHLI
jgi:putative endonuclease